jgi:Siphovirus Gp157
MADRGKAKMTPMHPPNLTLYQIETELLELVQLRDEIAEEVCVTPEAVNERDQTLAAIDLQVQEYLKREVQKVDNVAGFIRECTARAEIAKKEAERYMEIYRTWSHREKRVKDFAAEAIRQTVDERAITEATQGTVIKRLQGKRAQLKLCKSPASVAEPIDMSLLPEEYQKVIATLPADLWNRAMKAAMNAGINLSAVRATTEPMRGEIAARLKSGEPVPGVRLIEDNCHVRIG